MTMLATILGISMLIILHEFGHFLVARACGMRVLRFSVGFGPTLFSKKMGDTIWQVAAIPLGGFVQVHGMGPSEDESDAHIDPSQSYNNKPGWQRALVIFAGPAANWLISACLIAGLAMTVGVQKYDTTKAVIGDVVEAGPAAQGGLQANDTVVRINDEDVSDWSSMVSIISNHPEQALQFEIDRGGEVKTLTITPRKDAASDAGKIDVLPGGEREHFGVVQGLGAGITGAWNMTGQYGKMLWGLISGSQKGQLSGLPGIVKMVSQQAQRGLSRLFESLAWLSIGLCLLNLMPVPALDGGRLVFLGAELVRGKPVNEKVEGIIHTIGFALLIGLMIFVSVRDVLHWR